MPYGWAMAGAQGPSYGFVAASQAKRARKAQTALIGDLLAQQREISTGGMDPGQMRSRQTSGALQQQAQQAGLAEEVARGSQGRGLSLAELGQISEATAMGTAAQQQSLDQQSTAEAMTNAAARRQMQSQVTEAKYKLDSMPTPADAFGETLVKTSGDYAGQQAQGMGISSLGQAQQNQGAQNQATLAQMPQYSQQTQQVPQYGNTMVGSGNIPQFGSTYGSTTNPYSFGG